MGRREDRALINSVVGWRCIAALTTSLAPCMSAAPSPQPVVQANTARDIETCAILLGQLQSHTFIVQILLIPHQVPSSTAPAAACFPCMRLRCCTEPHLTATRPLVPTDGRNQPHPSLSRQGLHLTSHSSRSQTGSANNCETTNEDEIYDFCATHELVTLGWIHTHPSQTCFLSSVDLHTHCSWQVRLFTPHGPRIVSLAHSVRRPTCPC